LERGNLDHVTTRTQALFGKKGGTATEKQKKKTDKTRKKKKQYYKGSSFMYKNAGRPSEREYQLKRLACTKGKRLGQIVIKKKTGLYRAVKPLVWA